MQTATIANAVGIDRIFISFLRLFPVTTFGYDDAFGNAEGCEIVNNARSTALYESVMFFGFVVPGKEERVPEFGDNYQRSKMRSPYPL